MMMPSNTLVVKGFCTTNRNSGGSDGVIILGIITLILSLGDAEKAFFSLVFTDIAGVV